MILDILGADSGETNLSDENPTNSESTLVVNTHLEASPCLKRTQHLADVVILERPNSSGVISNI